MSEESVYHKAKRMLAEATPGPWGWFGYDGPAGNVHLATQHHGRLFVMTFKRSGMHQAAPVFYRHQRMGKYFGGTSDEKPWELLDRCEGQRIGGVVNPDAALIEEAPALIAGLLKMIDDLSTGMARDD